MDKLQWFKFTTMDWMMGKIQKCPEVTQARFLRLCCLYWNKDCNLSIEDAEIEIDKEHLDILLSKKIIKIVDDLIIIEFLNEQLSGICETSIKRRDAVNKRWEKKRSKEIQNNTSVFKNDTSVIQSDTDKSRVREEKIRVDNISKSHCDSSESLLQKNEFEKGIIQEEKEKEKKVPPKKEKETEYWDAILAMWFNYYKSKFQINPSFTSTDGKMLKSIVTKFKNLAKQKDAKENIDFNWNEDRVLRMFNKFLNQAFENKWLSENFLLKNLNSNFDSIITKNENNNGNKQSISGGTKEQYQFSVERFIKTNAGETE